MIKLEIGKLYVSRDSKIFTIIREINPDEPGYAKGYRFKGQTDRDESSDYSQIHVASFKPDGKHILNGVSSTLDLVSEHRAHPLMAKDVTGGMVVAEMHGHKVNFGILHGWKASTPTEITSDAYRNLLNCFVSDQDRETSVIENKMARSVGTVVNSKDYLRVVTVVYSYDHKYYMNTLYSPELS